MTERDDQVTLARCEHIAVHQPDRISNAATWALGISCIAATTVAFSAVAAVLVGSRATPLVAVGGAIIGVGVAVVVILAVHRRRDRQREWCRNELIRLASDGALRADALSLLAVMFANVARIAGHDLTVPTTCLEQQVLQTLPPLAERDRDQIRRRLRVAGADVTRLLFDDAFIDRSWNTLDSAAACTAAIDVADNVLGRSETAIAIATAFLTVDESDRDPDDIGASRVGAVAAALDATISALSDDTDRTELYVAVANDWSGSRAELLDAVDGVLAQPAA